MSAIAISEALFLARRPVHEPPGPGRTISGDACGQSATLSHPAGLRYLPSQCEQTPATKRSAVAVAQRVVAVNSSADAFDDFVSAEVPSLATPFIPSRWIASPLLQTVVANRLNRVAAPSTREVIRSDSGGSLAIDWIGCSGEPISSGGPVIIGFPGAGRCLPNNGFMPMLLAAVVEAFGGNCRCGVVVYQGLGGLSLSSHKLPCSAYGLTSDPGDALRTVRTRYADAPLIVFASSMGSSIFVNWASRNPAECARLRIGAAVCFAYGHSVSKTCAVAESYLGGAIGRLITKTWWRELRRNRASLEHLHSLEKSRPGFSVESLRRAASAGSLSRWDAAVAPCYGFADFAGMRNAAEPLEYLRQMPVWTLFLNAEDDMLCPAQRLRATDVYRSQLFACRFSDHGGHLGWCSELRFDGNGGHAAWLRTMAIEFVCAAAKLQAAEHLRRRSTGRWCAARSDPVGLAAPTVASFDCGVQRV